MANAQIFISYATKDREAAMEVCEALEGAGLTCWIAPRNVRPGKLYAEEIVSALRECRVVVVLLSSSANASPHVTREVDRAFSQSREVLVLRVEEVEATGALEYYLSGKQWLDGFSSPSKAHLAKLCNRAAEILGTDVQPNAGFELDIGEAPKDGFCLPWPCNIQTPITIMNAAVLLTDVCSLTSADLSPLVNKCLENGRTPVLVAPAIEYSVANLVKSAGGLFVEARKLKGQTIGDVLDDIGIYLGSYAQLQEWGFGLPLGQDGTEDITRGIVRRYHQVCDLSLDDFGMAREVRSDTKNVCFDAERTGPYLDGRLKELKYRAMHCTTDDEFEGVVARLRRFGFVEPMNKRLLQPPIFKIEKGQVSLPMGFASRYFVNELDSWRCRLRRTWTLVATFPLTNEDVLVPALENVASQYVKNGAPPLAVFAPEIRDSALAILVMNKLRGIAFTLAVETKRVEHLAAVADLTGAKLITEEHADRLRGPSVSDVLGRAGQIIAEANKTTVTK